LDRRFTIAFISHSLSVPTKANECLVLLTETASCSPSIHGGVAAVLHHLASTPPNASSISAPVMWRKMGGGKGSCKEWKVQGEEREGGEEEREGREGT